MGSIYFPKRLSSIFHEKDFLQRETLARSELKDPKLRKVFMQWVNTHREFSENSPFIDRLLVIVKELEPSSLLPLLTTATKIERIFNSSLTLTSLILLEEGNEFGIQLCINDEKYDLLISSIECGITSSLSYELLIKLNNKERFFEYVFFHRPDLVGTVFSDLFCFLTDDKLKDRKYCKKFFQCISFIDEEIIQRTLAKIESNPQICMLNSFFNFFKANLKRNLIIIFDKSVFLTAFIIRSLNQTENYNRLSLVKKFPYVNKWLEKQNRENSNLKPKKYRRNNLFKNIQFHQLTILLNNPSINQSQNRITFIKQFMEDYSCVDYSLFSDITSLFFTFSENLVNEKIKIIDEAIAVILKEEEENTITEKMKNVLNKLVKKIIEEDEELNENQLQYFVDKLIEHIKQNFLSRSFSYFEIEVIQIKRNSPLIFSSTFKIEVVPKLKKLKEQLLQKKPQSFIPSLSKEQKRDIDNCLKPTLDNFDLVKLKSAIERFKEKSSEENRLDLRLALDLFSLPDPLTIYRFLKTADFYNQLSDSQFLEFFRKSRISWADNPAIVAGVVSELFSLVHSIDDQAVKLQILSILDSLVILEKLEIVTVEKRLVVNPEEDSYCIEKKQLVIPKVLLNTRFFKAFRAYKNGGDLVKNQHSIFQKIQDILFSDVKEAEKVNQLKEYLDVLELTLEKSSSLQEIERKIQDKMVFSLADVSDSTRLEIALTYLKNPSLFIINPKNVFMMRNIGLEFGIDFLVKDCDHILNAIACPGNLLKISQQPFLPTDFVIKNAAMIFQNLIKKAS